MERRWGVVILLVGLACGQSASPTSTTTIRPLTTLPAPTTLATAIIPTFPSTGLATSTLASFESLIARPNGPLRIFANPWDRLPAQVIEAITVLGTPRVYLVEEGPTDGWVRLHLPVRPNGSSGWALARDVELSVVTQRLVVDISERILTVFEDGAEILSTPVAVGSETNPTPTGLFFVTDALETGNPKGAWGPFAFGLSAHSDTITEFNGGDGIIGIHGTSKPNSIGKAVSLGCVRVPNQVMLELAELVQLGVPVLIEE